MTAGFFGRTVKINQLNDVDDSSRSTDSILRFDGTKYKAVANTLKNLSDFNSSNLSDGDVPKYNATSGDFEPGQAGGGSSATYGLVSPVQTRWETTISGEATSFRALSYGDDSSGKPLVFFADNGSNNVGAINIETGVIQWESSVPSGIPDQTRTQKDSNGSLKIIQTSNGSDQAHCYDESGSIDWTFTLGGTGVDAEVVSGVANGTPVFFVADNSSSSNVYALDAVDGSIIWSVTRADPIPSGIENRTVDSTNSLMFLSDSHFVRLNADDGSEVVKNSDPNIIPSDLKEAGYMNVNAGEVFLAGAERGVYGINAVNGNQIWEEQTTSSNRAFDYGDVPGVGPTVYHIVEGDNHLGINVNDGTERFLDRTYASAPAIAYVEAAKPYEIQGRSSAIAGHDAADGNNVEWSLSISNGVETHPVVVESGNTWSTIWGTSGGTIIEVSQVQYDLHNTFSGGRE